MCEPLGEAARQPITGARQRRNKNRHRMRKHGNRRCSAGIIIIAINSRAFEASRLVALSPKCGNINRMGGDNQRAHQGVSKLVRRKAIHAPI